MQRLSFTTTYLIVLSIGFRVVGAGVVLEELSHVGHDGFLIRLVHVHIYRETQRRTHLDVSQEKRVDRNKQSECFSGLNIQSRP